LVLNDAKDINEQGLKSLGVSGVLKANDRNIQVVVGTRAEHLADIINKELKTS